MLMVTYSSYADII